jgi:hypothetical protein
VLNVLWFTKMTKRKIGSALSAKIALEALREHATVADLAQRYQVSSEPDLRLVGGQVP